MERHDRDERRRAARRSSVHQVNSFYTTNMSYKVKPSFPCFCISPIP